jgi:SAM-dependent methyltransferase
MGALHMYLERRTIMVKGSEEYISLMIPGPKEWEEDYCRRGILWSGAIRDLPELPSGSHILEIGCGNGKMVHAMVRRGWDVTAMDFSSRAVGFCRRAFPDPLYGQVMVADARRIPFKDDAFDAIFAFHIIGHLPAPDRKCVAGEVIRLLRTGGMLFFCEFSVDDFRFGKGLEMEESTFRRGTGILTHYFSEHEVADLFSGLTRVSVTIHQWPMRVRGCSLVRSEVQGVFTRG